MSNFSDWHHSFFQVRSLTAALFVVTISSGGLGLVLWGEQIEGNQTQRVDGCRSALGMVAHEQPSVVRLTDEQVWGWGAMWRCPYFRGPGQAQRGHRCTRPIEADRHVSSVIHLPHPALE